MRFLIAFSSLLLFASFNISVCTADTMESQSIKLNSVKCMKAGWQEIDFEILGHKRRLLYKSPKGPWKNGAILVLHGGGGKPEYFCDDSTPLVVPQVRFTEMAIDQKFAVFILDSTRIVTDNDGNICGKVWDDEVRERDNLDLPYLKHILEEIVPAKRPPGSNAAIFMAGHSSGGYMTVRATTNMGYLLNAVAAVSSGDPYGWTRRCDARFGDKRENVKGAGFDNETGKQIIEVNSCLDNTGAHEKEWDRYEGRKPVFRIFHNPFDGINDISCGHKVEKNLRKNGFSGEPMYLARKHDNRRRLFFHFWADEYNREILAFFKRHLTILSD